MISERRLGADIEWGVEPRCRDHVRANRVACLTVLGPAPRRGPSWAMPRVEVITTVGVDVESAFAMSQSQGEVRYAWDPFVRSQKLLDGAVRPERGVRTLTKSRHRLTMISEYTSFRAPNQVGMKMVEGPWFFSSFGGGWSFKALDEHTTEATWRYTFTIRPSWLSPLADRIGNVLLRRDIAARIEHFARACGDPDLVRAARAQLAGPR